MTGDISASGDVYLQSAKGIIFDELNAGYSTATIKSDSNGLNLIHEEGSFESGIRLNTRGKIHFANVHDGNLNFDTDT